MKLTWQHLIVVHDSIALCTIHHPSHDTRLLDQEESLLQNIPDHVTNHDGNLLRCLLQDGQVLKTYEQHGSPDPSRPDRHRAYVCLQEPDDAKATIRPNWSDIPHIINGQSAARPTVSTSAWRFGSGDLSVWFQPHVWPSLLLAEILH